jgi:hypothetical protein
LTNKIFLLDEIIENFLEGEMSGVYFIRCKPIGQIYIGGTRQTFDQKFQEHRIALRRGEASIPLLLAAWKAYGEDAFEFVPIKECPPSEVDKWERYAIERLHPVLNSPLGEDIRNRERNRHAYRRRRGLTGPALYAPPHMNVKRYDVGDGQVMSQSEIAERSGLALSAVSIRLKKGITGSALLRPPHRAPRKPYTHRIQSGRD